MIFYKIGTIDTIQVLTLREVLSDFMYRQVGQTAQQLEHAEHLYETFTEEGYDSEGVISDEDCEFLIGMFRDRQSQNRFKVWWDIQKTHNVLKRLGT